MTIRTRQLWLVAGSSLVLLGFFLPWMSVTTFPSYQDGNTLTPTGPAFAQYHSPSGPNVTFGGPNPALVWGIVILAVVLIFSALADAIWARIIQAVFLMIMLWLYMTNLVLPLLQILGANSPLPGDGFARATDEPCGSLIFDAHCHYLAGHPVAGSPGLGLFVMGLGIVVLAIGVLVKREVVPAENTSIYRGNLAP